MSLGNFTLSGEGFLTTRSLKIGNVPIVDYKIINDGLITGSIPNNALPNGITITNAVGAATSSSLNLSYPPITGTRLIPSSGINNDLIQISGSNFTNISQVIFSGNQTGVFNVISDNIIKTYVPLYATRGPITLISSGSSRTGYTPEFLPFPSISGITPLSGISGTQITISGFNFSNIVTGVLFNGIRATGLVVNSNTQITTWAPSGYIEGKISVTGSGNVSGCISGNFLLNVLVTGISPSSGYVGSAVSILGRNFFTGYLSPISGKTTYLVNFAGRQTGFYYVNTGQLTGIVPTGVISGSVSLYHPNGLLQYPTIGTFRTKQIQPVLTKAILPHTLYTGTMNGFTIFGSGLSNVTQIRLSGYSPWNYFHAFDITSNNYVNNAAATLLSVTGYTFAGTGASTGITSGNYSVKVTTLEGFALASGSSGILFA